MGKTTVTLDRTVPLKARLSLGFSRSATWMPEDRRQDVLKVATGKHPFDLQPYPGLRIVSRWWYECRGQRIQYFSVTKPQQKKTQPLYTSRGFCRSTWVVPIFFFSEDVWVHMVATGSGEATGKCARAPRR